MKMVNQPRPSRLAKVDRRSDFPNSRRRLSKGGVPCKIVVSDGMTLCPTCGEVTRTGLHPELDCNTLPPTGG